MNRRLPFQNIIKPDTPSDSNPSKVRLVLQRVGLAIVFAFASVGITLAVPSAASANAETCLLARDGYMCTNVLGDGGRVDAIYSIRVNGNLTEKSVGQICNYSAYFFAIHKDGHVEDLGKKLSQGCSWGRVWLKMEFGGRDFPRGTLICSKFMEDRWATYVGEKCVRLR